MQDTKETKAKTKCSKCCKCTKTKETGTKGANTKETGTKNVYSITITLVDSKPKIWRRVEISCDSTFFDLHHVIQQVMPWEDFHLHCFTIKTKGGDKIRISDPFIGEDSYEDITSEEEALLFKYLPDAKSIVYEYDFGDSWEHEIKVDKIVPAKDGVLYPRCTGGEMACPPEDCGGICAYYEMLEILNGEDCEDKVEMLEWLGGGFDPNKFDINDVKILK
ncbi:MAG: plasmid pRiA4b ORF-3 family protein [Holosporales bacterium]|jgi:hypothetical protein|nr:plasmid pRiA4b ORF-3 family protein [Holosporales bacterium]